MENEYHDDDVPLPGFRFHPTDEELVGFYLQRKVNNKPIKIELIKQADIYKYDPWDLPKYSNNNGDKEWYFFCRRGRKYKNSIRPNRVTGSGFWKATGIDKPIYSSNREGPKMKPSCVIGLKKSLVYYLGSAGKGTKTEWMMHEFRLPQASHDNISPIDQEAEVWTLCRILKREASYSKRHVPDWREFTSKKRSSSLADSNVDTNPTLDVGSETYSMEFNNCDGQSNNYISFSNSTSMIKSNDHRQIDHETKPYQGNAKDIENRQFNAQHSTNLFSTFACNDVNELLRHGDWDYLRNILDAAGASTYNYCYPL